MGSVFRPKRGGVRQRKYRICWTDERGDRKTATAYTDHAASRAMLDRKERECARRREGLPVADERKRLMPAPAAVEEYVRELASRGSDPRGMYVREQRRMLMAAFNDCSFANLGDVRKDAVRSYLSRMAERGVAPGTRALHGQALRGMLRWAVDQEWLAADPLEGLKLPRVGEAGRRRRRRALTLPELLALLEAAPERRANLYRLAALSGFRRRELRLMRRCDFDPRGDRPCWKLQAASAKNRRLDVVPMCPDARTVALPVWESLASPQSRLLESPLLCRAVPAHVTFRADLDRAGIARVDGEGRHADFHALRYTFCRLMAETLPIQVVKVLMRHSSIRMTCDVYAQLGIDDVGERVWELPSVLTVPPPE